MNHLTEGFAFILAVSFIVAGFYGSWMIGTNGGNGTMAMLNLVACGCGAVYILHSVSELHDTPAEESEDAL